MADDEAIEIQYGDEIVIARRGNCLLDTILDAGLDHRHICGGNGFCTSCRVEVIEGALNLSHVSRLERDRLGKDAGRLRLACQTRVLGPTRVRVPPAAPPRFSPFDPEP